ncbi:hypothetical protein D9M70_429170 [compost metagenome]
MTKAKDRAKRSNDRANEMRILAAQESGGLVDSIIIFLHLLACLVDKPAHVFDATKLVTSD